MYAVRIRDKRYIAWCDDCWYETTESPNFIFTKDRAMEIVSQLTNHYVYASTIVDENGNEETFDVIAEIKAKRMARAEETSMVDDCFEI